jgi:hypothetical protein
VSKALKGLVTGGKKKCGGHGDKLQTLKDWIKFLSVAVLHIQSRG